jgi:hypothetical protein
MSLPFLSKLLIPEIFNDTSSAEAFQMLNKTDVNGRKLAYISEGLK